ncbi:MAG TPA: NYN domain-containing protein, partial [Planctomycetota bacterium]|nr:NYN domain-containing protein [Planctomycetota bacterium]
LCYAKAHLDAFVILSGDSDFSPLVSKLRENNKYVIGLGVKQSTSDLLVDNCDEFIFYDDLARREERRGAEKTLPARLQSLPKKKAEAFFFLVDAIQALVRENKDVLWGSMIKETIKRKRPSFDETYHGYSTFSKLLEDAEREKLVQLKRDDRSGGYIVTAFADDVAV